MGLRIINYAVPIEAPLSSLHTTSTPSLNVYVRTKRACELSEKRTPNSVDALIFESALDGWLQPGLEIRLGQGEELHNSQIGLRDVFSAFCSVQIP